jgi:hypothetical protein
MSKLVGPAYDPKEGTVPKPFSEPAKLGQPEENRAYQISVKGDNDKDFYIGIKDIDEAVMYYFNNVLNLSVIQNNNRLTVPVIYGTPENWKSVQVDGYYRDENGKLMAPLLMFKRSSITQNRTLGNKLDGNKAHNLQVFQTAFNKRNFYSNFQALNSRAPETKYVVAITPDYVTVEYDCIVWTYYVEQMDKLIESLNFASRSYWGDPNRFQFYSSIESFEDAITYNLGENRAVRSNFRLTLNGYLIPDSINKRIANAERYFGISQILFGLETADSSEELTVKYKQQSESSIASPLTSIPTNIVVDSTVSDAFTTAAVSYLLINKVLTGTYSSPTTCVFAGTWATAPSPLPATNLDNFTFFVNGQYIEKTAIVSFSQVGAASILVIDPNILQFSFDETDLILAVGKFN